MRFPRASGILLHPTSLPGDFGIGDLGPNAFEFVDFLARAGQKYWQILPLSPTGHGNSPYSAYSAFAGNTLMISPEKLLADGLLAPSDLEKVPVRARNKVDFEKVRVGKTELLSKAFANFRAIPNSPLGNEFDYFSHVNGWWLDDYALFRALKDSTGQKPWFEWAAPLKLRDKDALDKVRSQLSREISGEKFAQYLFFRQWLALKKYANEKGIKIVGDIPIFVALDSADVWCNQTKFKLNKDGSPKVVAGVPPDYFSKTGQLWGNPIYDWDAMRADKFGWWAARLSFTLMSVDIVRLDHFIGFIRNWEVPGGDKTAEKGIWAAVPGVEIFKALRSQLGDIPIIAEDLGSMTPEVEHLRDSLEIPGMRILQYAFGGDAYNRDLPHNYIQNSVAYTGTHDNDTTVGWYKSAAKNVRSHCRKYLGSSGREIHWDMIRAIFASVADMAIIPAQDVLGLRGDSRMNTPATAKGNWEWRLKENDLTDKAAEKLRDLAETYGRADKADRNG
ncbi:MAG TPA: 4-alpha-glucanotransferase [Pyrinomonadaceae bacterium]|nr:4-alpha-glucanotransferase [Pyrinomonadaceae bacterium]